jgi:hypothetical protein
MATPTPGDYTGSSRDFSIVRQDRGRPVRYSPVDGDAHDYPGLGDSADDDMSEED